MSSRFGAHPDDVEIACGGTLARLAQLGYKVGIVDLTDGEPTPLCDDPAIRRAEATAAAEKLGVNIRKILSQPNRRLFDSFEARVALATEFRRYRPRLVIGFGDKTPMASPDHWQAMQITDAAVFYSRLTNGMSILPVCLSTQSRNRFTSSSHSNHYTIRWRPVASSWTSAKLSR